MKKRFFLLILVLVLVIPFKVFAYTEPALFFAGQKYTESANGTGWDFDFENKILTLNNYKFNGNIDTQNNYWSFIESDYETLTINVVGTNTINITGYNDNENYNVDAYGIRSDITTSVIDENSYNNNAHIYFTGSGILNVNLTGGRNIYGIFGNYVNINGPRVNINITGDMDVRSTTDLNEATESVTGISLKTFEMSSGKIGITAYSSDMKTIIDGMNTENIVTTGGEISSKLVGTVAAAKATACGGKNASFSNTKINCIASNTTTATESGEALPGHNVGMHYSNSLTFNNCNVTGNIRRCGL